LADFPRRGQIYWVDFSPSKGSEQDGRRPAVIVSNDTANQHGSVVVVAPVTSKTKNSKYPQNVLLHANDPLPKSGLILCGQVRTIAKLRLESYRADLSAVQLRKVERALATVLALPKPDLLH
jgi:mRNA interferase MazF